MRIFSHPRFLPIYSGVLTAALAVIVLTGAARPTHQASFDEIDVQRINVREPDGTLRMTISNNARLPGLYDHGHEFPHDRRRNEDHTAGMLFFDGEGSESGGLSFGGQKNADGSISREGSLSFDQYDQDQVAVLSQGDYDGKHLSGIGFHDLPNWTTRELIDAMQRTESLPEDQRAGAMQEFMSTHRDGVATRAYLGRRDDKSAVLELSDASDRVRLLLKVTADGQGSLQFLDDKGVVTEQCPRPAATVKKP